jgi:hypothetical protein
VGNETYHVTTVASTTSGADSIVWSIESDALPIGREVGSANTLIANTPKRLSAVSTYVSFWKYSLVGETLHPDSSRDY